MAQAQSDNDPIRNDKSWTVANSTLTPLAKEFVPNNSGGSSSTNGIEHKQGAIKKGTYWNKDKNQYRSRNKSYNTDGFNNRYKNHPETSSSSRYPKYNNSRSFYSNDFSKSSEQSKVLQDTKRFLQQVKDIEETKTKDTNIQHIKNSIKVEASNSKNNNTFVANQTKDQDAQYTDDQKYLENNSGSKQSSTGDNKYYASSNRFKNYKKPYKKEFNKFNNRGKSYSYEKAKDEERIRVEIKEPKQLNSESSFNRNKIYGLHNLKKKLDAGSQRERLEQQIRNRLLECLVCCEKLRHNDQIWSCKQCFHVLHLQCTKRWAQSSKLEIGWRCPACQNVYQDVPNEYRCYCTKLTNPTPDPGGIPHSCGETCGKKGRSCSHNCTIICHPGPCPDCTIMVARPCGCGATSPFVKCSSNVPITCQKKCDKFLNCGIHKCLRNCHEGACNLCSEDLRQECYCGKVGRKIKCSSEAAGVTTYECGEICDKLLTCANHRCTKLCHEGPCDDCNLSPGSITTCPCGQTVLKEVRKSCTDPIPCCDKICAKKLVCGQPGAPHLCKSLCHEAACPPCLRTTLIRCRCGHMDKEIPCEQVTTKADDARCEKKCTKKRICGKHKCNQLCCIEIDHVCLLLCNRLLSCGQHRCEETCHKGRCPPCWRTSFEELFCECGSSVLYPPVACGTRPPPCDQPCSRPQPCEHNVMHSCHTGPCPPCTVLTKRWCHGNHEQRGTIPCHQENFSCGLPCGRDMPCKRHKCNQSCHSGQCRTPCTQPCLEIRSICGHPCNHPCHAPPCPETSCKQLVKVTCQCGLRKSNRVCMELTGEYQNITMTQLASKMEEIQMGHSVDISDIVSGTKKGSLKTLDCSEECRLVERNRRLAIGLQIRNPDLSSKLTPRYSDFMRGWARKDTKFCQQIHDKLTELVQLAKQSKQRSRSYSFESMNRDKRHFVHEYCEHFGCDSAAYDPEPNRNVVATAFKDKSWLPSYSLLQIIQRESGQRKVPGPQQLGKNAASTKTEAVSLKVIGRTHRPGTPPGEYVDYFDNPPE